MPLAERIMSVFVPVIATVVTTAMSTVITVAHTRRGARSMVAAASAPTEPNIRAVAAVALTMGTVSAKPSAISAQNTADIATKAKAAALVDDDHDRRREHRDGRNPGRDPQPSRHAVRGRNPDGCQCLDR